MRPRTTLLPAATLAVLWSGLGPGAAAAEVDPARLPPAATHAVDFEQDIRPIFESTCLRCHGPERPKSGFRLDNQESALRGGDLQKEDIVPGDSGKSLLIHYVARLVEDLEMPPPGKGEPLTPEQIGLLRKWIDDGAKWSVGSERAKGESMVEVTAFGRYLWVDGDEGKFREHAWMREGAAGGIEKFGFKEWISPDVEFSGDGRAFIDQNDYRLSLTLRKRDVGFLRGGYDTYRRYFDDSGGYYPNPPLAGPPLSLGRDLSVDVSRAWLDAGLTRPDLPRITIGYEFQEKEGDRSLLSWGAVQDAPTLETKAIAPSAKAIDDQTHLFKLDADYPLGGWLLEDVFRAELYDLRTSRGYPDPFPDPSIPVVTSNNDESYRHFQAANAFRVERQFKDWLLGSAGYLFTHLDADAGFQQSVSFGASVSDGDQSTQIILEQNSHTFNANAMLGPSAGLTLSAGGQVEWLHREGISDLINPTFGFGTALGSDLDKTSIQEDVGLRFTDIPFTVLYADLRFGQEWLDQYESSAVGDGIDDAQDFLRDTDTVRNLRQYRAGFTLSPWTPVSLDASYQHRDQHNEYDHVVDSNGSDPLSGAVSGDGYPAHILDHRILSDEVEARLTWRIVSWLKATLKYQWFEGEYQTTTEVSPTGAPLFYPGGRLVSGRQDADIYSVALVLTPWRRLYLSPSFSYTDSEVRSAVDAPGVVVPYEGDIYSLLLSGNYLLSRKVELNATYSGSRADYAQANLAGLPVGMEYTRHAVFGGLTHRIYKHLRMSYQYGFFRYDEPSSGGYDDYTAHAVLCSVNLTLP